MLPRDYNENGSLGVKHDALVDGLTSIRDAHHKLTSINVMLDSLADDPSIWTDDELTELRSMQRTVQSLIDEQEQNEQDTEAEIEDIRDADGD